MICRGAGLDGATTEAAVGAGRSGESAFADFAIGTSEGGTATMELPPGSAAGIACIWLAATLAVIESL